MRKGHIKLRAHHLYFLARCYYDNRFVEFLNRIPLLSEFNDFVEAIFGIYGFRHVYRRQKIYRRIMKNPSLNVEIIDTLDDICLPFCKLRNKECDSGESGAYLAKGWNIEIGRVYTSGEIADFVKKNYKSLLGFS